MTASPHQENNTSSEPEKRFPIVGDIISAPDHFPLGVVVETEPPYGVQAGAISTLEDGTEQLALPGTVKIEEIHSIEGRWDVDRIVAAWAKTWKMMMNGTEMSPEAQASFREELLGRIALQNGAQR